MSKYGVFSGPYFPVFGLNTKIYGVNLRIQSECRKIRTRKDSVFGHVSRIGKPVSILSHSESLKRKRNFEKTFTLKMGMLCTFLEV